MSYKIILKNKQPDPVKHKCSDCFFCQADKEWACVNEQAVQHRGTNAPDGGCKYWKAARTWHSLTSWQKFNMLINPLSHWLLIK